MVVLKGGQYLTPDGGFEYGDIVLHGAEIASVNPNFNCRDEDEIIDITGCLVIPGLVDIHTHGALGYDVSVSSPEEIVELSKFYAKNGVTSFMPTTMTAADEDIYKAISNIKAAAESEQLGSSIVGVHTEGPYINPVRGGCHEKDLIRLPKAADADRIRESLGKKLKWRVTVAPEMPGMPDFIRYVTEKGGLVSIGHTDADAKTVYEAIDAGANCFTHLFNAMKGIHHREPGTAGAALISDTFAELICDGIHVNPEIVKLIYKAKGAGQMVLITDSMPATGLDDQNLIFGGVKVIVKNGIARTEDGTLAGSTLLLKDAVENLTRFTGMPFEDAVRTATVNPAKVIGIDRFTGSMYPGKRADFVVMDDNHQIIYTYCRGKKVYSAV